MKKNLFIILIAVIYIGATSSKEINWDTQAIISNLKKCENKEFRDNCIDQEKLPDGGTYYGEFSNNKREGYGKALLNDGSIYEGMYFAGKKHGLGIYAWNDGSRYEGEWFENKIRGVGTYTWLDGRKY